MYDYYHKYLKYKNKYLNLKFNKIGGGELEDIQYHVCILKNLEIRKREEYLKVSVPKEIRKAVKSSLRKESRENEFKERELKASQKEHDKLIKEESSIQINLTLDKMYILGFYIAKMFINNLLENDKMMNFLVLMMGTNGTGKTEINRAIISYLTTGMEQINTSIGSPSFFIVKIYNINFRIKGQEKKIRIIHVDPNYLVKRRLSYYIGNINADCTPTLWLMEHGNHFEVQTFIKEIPKNPSYPQISITLNFCEKTNESDVCAANERKLIINVSPTLHSGLQAFLLNENIFEDQEITDIINDNSKLRIYGGKEAFRETGHKIMQLVQLRKIPFNNLVILAVETSHDGTHCCITKNGKVIYEFDVERGELFKEKGGIDPSDAGIAHSESLTKNFPILICKSMELTGKIPDVFAVTIGPGLALSLVPGIFQTQLWAYKCKKPLIGINHLHAHALTATMHEFKFDIHYPLLAFIVSGGHTFLSIVRTVFDFEIVWSTPNDTAGETGDKCARMLGVQKIPGGPELEKLASEGNPQVFISAFRDKETFSDIKETLKRILLGLVKEKYGKTVVDEILTLAINAQDIAISEKIDTEIKNNLAATVQFCIGKLLEKLLINQLSEIKKSKIDIKCIVASGGALCNLTYRKIVEDVSHFFCIKCFIPPIKYAKDNGAMIANLAINQLRNSGLYNSDKKNIILCKDITIMSIIDEPKEKTILQCSRMKIKGIEEAKKK